MKRFNTSRNSRYAITGAVAICLTLAVTGIWQTVAKRNTDEASRQYYVGLMRDSLGELPAFDTVKTNRRGSARMNAESLCRYIQKRSGLELSAVTSERLAMMEERVLRGDGQRIRIADLGRLLSTWAVDRLAVLTDEEVDYAIETLQGFDSADLPDGARRERDRILPRANHIGPKVTDDLISEIRSFRKTIQESKWPSRLVESVVAERVLLRARVILEAVTDDTSAEKVTPLQAFLITYSLASDDYLYHSEANLRTNLHTLYEAKAGRVGYFSEPHFAYGPNGFIYSSPTDILLKGEALTSLLQLLDEASV